LQSEAGKEGFGGGCMKIPMTNLQQKHFAQEEEASFHLLDRIFCQVFISVGEPPASEYEVIWQLVPPLFFFKTKRKNGCRQMFLRSRPQNHYWVNVTFKKFQGNIDPHPKACR
jgi:hypothetical protein